MFYAVGACIEGFCCIMKPWVLVIERYLISFRVEIHFFLLWESDMYQARILLGWLCYFCRNQRWNSMWERLKRNSIGFCFVWLFFTISQFSFAFTITHMCMGLITGAHCHHIFSFVFCCCSVWLNSVRTLLV